MRTLSWISAAVCLMIAAPHAQDAGRTQQPPPAPAHTTMMLTGCLAAGSDESTFKLTNAIPNSQASASQPQSVGTSGERAEYELRAEKNLDTTGLAPVELKPSSGVRSKSLHGRATSQPPLRRPRQTAMRKGIPTRATG